MNSFREAVIDCGLRDVVFEGYEFTFDNGQANEANRQCRLDRAMGNEGWFELFSYAQVGHLVIEWSDHSPIKLWLERRRDNRDGKKLFHFEQLWIGEEECEDTIRLAWGRGRGRNHG
ncbi:uncharacterized protein LOC141602254 [Silene latifolia]|uniref:uncharacterized protein LOC141602254 n=1 Tax=Silene latifolia TaxID=37657 RepID=UPI003D77EA01